MKITYSALALLLVLFACSKDDFETKPKIEIKSFGPGFIPNAGDLSVRNLNVRIEFRDKEGDVDDSLIVIRERLNNNSFAPRFELKYNIPEFPTKSKGEFEVTIPYATGLTLQLTPLGNDPEKFENDTLRLKFVAKDRGGNISDTAVIERVIVERKRRP